MSLTDLIERVEAQQKELVVLNPAEDDLVSSVRSYFEDQNVTVVGAETASGTPADVVVLTRGDQYLAGASGADLRDLLAATPSGPGGLGFDDSGHEQLLQHLKETTFTSYSTGDMLAATREIEDRAWRVGEGRLYAGFQFASKLRNEQVTYDDLTKKALEIHVYASPDEPFPEIGGVTAHPEANSEIEETWFVAFDGDGDDLNKSAILAEERDDGFYGFWTYNPTIVDEIIDYLDRRYDRVSA